VVGGQQNAAPAEPPTGVAENGYLNPDHRGGWGWQLVLTAHLAIGNSRIILDGYHRSPISNSHQVYS